MERTADIASFPAAHSANQVATLLRANGIECAVEPVLQENLGPIASPEDGGMMYHVRVAHDDGARARDVTGTCSRPSGSCARRGATATTRSTPPPSRCCSPTSPPMARTI